MILHGLSTGDFAPELKQFVGTGAGLWAAPIIHLTNQWQAQAQAFVDSDLSKG